MTSYIALFHFNEFWTYPLLGKLISPLIMDVINIKTHFGAICIFTGRELQFVRHASNTFQYFERAEKLEGEFLMSSQR